MGKGPRHDPNKRQNKMGDFCPWYEETRSGYGTCEKARKTTKCKGNPHNCIKVTYQILTSRSDIQKNNGVGITGYRSHY